MRVLLLAALAAACAPATSRTAASLTPPSAYAVPTGFPVVCAPDEVQVMLLGTYGFQGNGADPVKQSPDDMLSTRRQEELQELAARLAEWEPQQVVVEHPFAMADTTAARYRRYVAGSLAATRSEAVQIGFRVARRLGHADVVGFDQPRIATSDSAVALLRRRPDLQRPIDAAMQALRRQGDSVEAWRRETSVTDHLRELNTDAALHGGNSYALFGGFLSAGEGGNAGGAEVIADWYARNIHMAHNLTRVLRPGVRRVLVLVESGHVPALRNILDEAPQFCPVSPLPFLR